MYLCFCSMEDGDGVDMYGGDAEYDNYYENGWFQDEYGEWYQDPNYVNPPNQSNFSGKENNQLTINGPLTTIDKQNNALSAKNKNVQNATLKPSSSRAK